MKLGYSNGPVTDTELVDLPLSWYGLVQVLRHREGSKGGAYLLRGPGAPRRCDSNLAEAHLAVIDGDHGLDGAPAPSARQVHRALEGTRHLVATTHSHRPEAPRWRLFAPVSRPYSRQECPRVTKALWQRLVGAGVPLELSPESERWAQPWFTPRHAPGAPWESFVDHGRVLDVEQLLAEVPAETPAPAPRRPAPPRRGPITDFNLETDVGALLESAGYRFRGYRRMSDGTLARAYLHPWSESQVPGTFLVDGRSGKQVVLSFSTGDPLHQERGGRPLPLDAWDVSQTLAAG